MNGWVFIDYLRFNTEWLLEFKSSTIIIFEVAGVVSTSLGVERPNITCFYLIESFGELLFFLFMVELRLKFNWVVWSSGLTIIYVVSGEIILY